MDDDVKMGTREEITEQYMISESGMASMHKAYINGNASPMIWLIKSLKIMLETINNGHSIYSIDDKTVIDKLNFKDFVLKHFDDFVYKEIFSDSFLYDN